MEKIFEHTDIEGTTFTLIPIIRFEDFVIKKYNTLVKFNDLSLKDREKIFLRWKWGFDDDRANEELNLNEKQILFLFKDKDLGELNGVWKFHIEHKQQFDRICYATKSRIGLTYQRNPTIDKLTEVFDASEY